MTFHVHLSILPQAPSLTKIKVFGDLPLLQINFSDRKYKTLMRIVDLVVPKDDAEASTPPLPKQKSGRSIALLGKSSYKDDLVLGDTTEGDSEDEHGVAIRGKKSQEMDKVMYQQYFLFVQRVTSSGTEVTNSLSCLCTYTLCVIGIEPSAAVPKDIQVQL